MSNARFPQVRIPREREYQMGKAGYKAALLIAAYVFGNMYEEVDADDVQHFVNKCDELLREAEKSADSWRDINTWLRRYTGRDIVYEG